MTESPPTPPPTDGDQAGQAGHAEQAEQTPQAHRPGQSAGSTLSELRRLRRAKTGRVVGGVCAGLGRDLGVDPVILRVVLAVMIFFSGVGLLIYGAAWLLIPEEGDERSILERQLGRRPNGQPDKAVVIAGVVVLFLLIASVPWWGFSWHPAALLLLAGAGMYVLLRRSGGGQSGDGYTAPPEPPSGSTDFTTWLADQRSGTGPAGAPADRTQPTGPADATGITTTGTTSGPVAPEPTPTGSWRDFRPPPEGFWHQPDPLGLQSDGPPPEQPAPPPIRYAPPPPPAPRQPRSRLFWVTSAFALIVVGALALVDNGAPVIPAAAYVAAPLAVVGLGLIAGAWWGRSPGLVVTGVLLSLALVPTSFGEYLEDRGAGSVTARPASVAEIQDSYDYGAGEFLLDLRNVSFLEAEDVTTSIDCGACSVTVILPQNVDATVTADVGIADVSLFPELMPERPDRPSPPGDESTGEQAVPEYDGFDDQIQTTDLGADGAGGGTLNLNIDLGVGELEVLRG